jgi:hypothetical protein
MCTHILHTHTHKYLRRSLFGRDDLSQPAAVGVGHAEGVPRTKEIDVDTLAVGGFPRGVEPHGLILAESRSGVAGQGDFRERVEHVRGTEKVVQDPNGLRSLVRSLEEIVDIEPLQSTSLAGHEMDDEHQIMDLLPQSVVERDVVRLYEALVRFQLHGDVLGDPFALVVEGALMVSPPIDQSLEPGHFLAKLALFGGILLRVLVEYRLLQLFFVQGERPTHVTWVGVAQVGEPNPFSLLSLDRVPEGVVAQRPDEVVACNGRCPQWPDFGVLAVLAPNQEVVLPPRVEIIQSSRKSGRQYE